MICKVTRQLGQASGGYGFGRGSGRVRGVSGYAGWVGRHLGFGQQACLGFGSSDNWAKLDFSNRIDRYWA